jgi:diguanylate cyclase (GGDEF)-like protein
MPIRFSRYFATFARACLILWLSGAVGVVIAARNTTLEIGQKNVVPVSGAHLSWLEDAAGDLGIDDVANGPARDRFMPVGDDVASFGLSSSAYWLRFTVRLPHDDGRDWMIKVDFPLLDHVDLYVPEGLGSPTSWRHLLSGDALPFRLRPVEVPDIALPLPVQPGVEQTIYLRVQSTSTVIVPIELITKPALIEDQQERTLVFGAFYGAILALALYNLLLYIPTRDRTFLVYVSFVSCMGIALLSYNGFAYKYLWPEAVEWNARAPLVLGQLTLALSAFFTRSFLSTRTIAPSIDQFLQYQGMISVAIAVACLGVFTPHFAALALIAMMIVNASALLLAFFVCLRMGYRPARWAALAGCALIIGAVAQALRALGTVPANFFTLYGVQIGAALEMLLLSFALADRISQVRLEKEQAQAQALTAKELALDALRRSERDLENLVGDRVQELAKLNRALEVEVRVRRHAEDMLRNLAHHDPLTGLPNRTLLKDRFESALASAKRREHSLAVLLLDLDNLKIVNDTLGHDAGDDLLVAAGNTMRSLVRGMDTVARTGGDEFVILLTDLQTENGAQEVARKLIERFADPAVSDKDAHQSQHRDRLLSAGRPRFRHAHQARR